MLHHRTLFFVVVVVVGLAVAQEEAGAQTVRKLAPGILTVIPPEPLEQETFVGPLSLQDVSKLDWNPNFTPKTDTLRQKSAQVTLRHNIWNLELAFKPVRMVHVDIPQPSGKMQRKLIWYMVYRVRNLGGHLIPVPDADKTYKPEPADEVLNFAAAQPSNTIRFFPHFVLESTEVGKAYLDRIIPAAIPLIQLREMRGARLLNSVEITQEPIPVVPRDGGPGVWGVVTWEDVDPRIDFFSIYVQGLTNAFRMETSQTGGVTQRLKTLQLNFWRPSDTIDEHEDEIRYGVPSVTDPQEQAAICARYNIPRRVDYLWVYR